MRDAAVVERVAAAVEREGSDVWYSTDAARFLGNQYDPAEWDKVTDIIEVWFDSGSTHAFVLEKRPELKWPASLYLEGSDQHRGWFNSSLIEACGTRGHAPFEAVLTHGFVLDEDGRKMSKSLGNVIAPQDIMKQSGADILRLWVVASDYAEDLRIGPEILKHMGDAYRRLRNTLRYLLGALAGFTPEEAVAPQDMPELERWVLHRLAELDQLVRRSIAEYDFHGLFTALHNFCAVDLSAFYFDIRKDRLYCDGFDDPQRRAPRTVLDRTFDCLVRWLAPILCFTAEEAWLARYGEADGAASISNCSPRCRNWRDPPWRSAGPGCAICGCRDRRPRSRARREAHRVEPAGGGRDLRARAAGRPLGDVDLAELCITSARPLAAPPPAGAFTLPDAAGIGVVVSPAIGARCERCWRVLPEVGHVPGHDDLCQRCAEVIDRGAGAGIPLAAVG